MTTVSSSTAPFSLQKNSLPCHSQLLWSYIRQLTSVRLPTHPQRILSSEKWLAPHGVLLSPYGGFCGLLLRSPLLACWESVNFPQRSPIEMNCPDKLRLVQLRPPAHIPACDFVLAAIHTPGAWGAVPGTCLEREKADASELSRPQTPVMFHVTDVAQGGVSIQYTPLPWLRKLPQAFPSSLPVTTLERLKPLESSASGFPEGLTGPEIQFSSHCCSGPDFTLDHYAYLFHGWKWK